MKVGIIPINIGVQSADQIVQTAQLVESLLASRFGRSST